MSGQADAATIPNAHPEADAARRLGAEGEHWADELNTTVTIQFDWLDRLRILFGRPAFVQVRTKTEFATGKLKDGGTRAWCAKVFDFGPKVMTMGEAPKERDYGAGGASSSEAPK